VVRFDLDLTVADIMTTQVLTLAAGEDLQAAERLMQEAGVRHLPVVDDQHRLVGLVTHRDVLRFSPSQAEVPAALSAGLAALRVGQVMARTLVTVRPETPLADAARTLLSKKFGCLPVDDPDGRLVGILTESDFVALVFRLLAHLDKGSEHLDRQEVRLTERTGVPMVASPTVQEGNPMLELTRKQVEVFAGGLYTLASSDGIDPRELSVIREFLESVGAPDLAEKLPELRFDAVDAYHALQTSWLRGLFLRAALLLVRSDGAVTDKERETLTWMADVFGIQGGYEALVAKVEGEKL
jgi:CBS domain-containing protein